MNDAAVLELFGAFGSALLGCWAVNRAVDRYFGVAPAESLTPQWARMIGRLLVTLTLLAVGVGLLGKTPWAITAGTLGGWLLAGSWKEARRRLPRERKD